MKKFCIKILCFASFFLFVLFIDLIISKSIKFSGFLDSWNDIYNNNINADLVIFGTSRAQAHLVSNIIEDSLNIKVYNLGGITQPVDLQIIRLIEHLKHCTKKPKYISLEICFFSIENHKGVANDYQIYPWCFLNKTYIKYTDLLFESYPKYYFYIPLIRYKGSFFKLINEYSTHKTDTCDKGYYNNFSNSKMAKQDFNYKITINQQRVRYLKQFIEICQANKIKINIIYTPEYYKQKLYKNKQEILDTINNLVNTYKIPFYNFSNDSIEINKDTTYFSDYCHMNKLGANKFTSEYYVPWIKQLYGL